MKNLLITLTGLLILTLATSCNQYKIDNIIKVEIASVLKQNSQNSTLATGWYYIVDEKNGFKRQLDKTDEFYFIDPKPIIINAYFDKVETYETKHVADPATNQFALSIQIHRNYEHLWANATEKAIGKRLALIINNKLVSNPKVMGRIEGGLSSLGRGVYNKDDLDKFIKQIEEYN